MFQRSSATPRVESTPLLATPTLDLTPIPTAEPILTPSAPVIVRVWVPPQFDPASNTTAGTMLQSRFDQFTAAHPEIIIEVRVKSIEGPGGLLEGLSTAAGAAPLALPDVVALPRPLLEAAALKGLIHPFTDPGLSLDDPDWYPYARDLGRLQNSTFGLPFASDALALVYRPDLVPQAPQDWPTLLKINGALIFPAADPQALFTLALYQSAGGAIQDDQGRPVFDVPVLSQVLSFYRDASQTNVMPYTLTQYETDEQVWSAFQSEHTLMAITWVSNYLDNGNPPADTRIRLLPTSDGTPFTMATGWMWALAGTQPERQAIGAQLAVFLSSGDFLAEWSLAIGYLPTRASAIAGWDNTGLQELVTQVGKSARPIPSADVLSSLGAPLLEAVIQVLKQQKDPLTAAQDAADYLRNP